MKEKFKLSHVVLYAKGWYEKTDNVWEDLKKILVLDNYTPFTNSDVFSIMVSSFQKIDCRQSELREVLFGIHPSECWKVGYYVKENKDWARKEEQDSLPNYNMPTATIYYILSYLRFIDRENWEEKIPNYKFYPKPKNISNKKVKEVFKKCKTM